MRKTLLLLLALAVPASAVGIRVATFNIGAHFNETHFDYGLGDAGTPDHETVEDILRRVDADVVALQEIASLDVHASENPTDLQVLAASLGYAHVYVAPVTSAPPLTSPLDSSLRVAFLSRHPFLDAAVVRSPEGARELTRLHPVVKVDVPGTDNNPWLISTHLKSGTASDDKFRRTVDMMRLVGHFNAMGLSGDDNYVLLGDFNLTSSNSTYTTLPAGLSPSYDLGDDISLPINYSNNPLSYFTVPTVTRLDPRQLNGSAATFQSGSVLDLLLVSPAIAGRPLATEIYNSALDVSNGAGLPKAGEPLASGTSATASDHYAVFADLELDSDLPDLSLALSAPTLVEGLPVGTVALTVTLPATMPVPVTVTFSSDDPAVVPAVPEVVIPAGNLSGNAPVSAPRNFIADPPRTVTFTAAASGYDPDSSSLQVLNADGPYAIAAAGQAVVESFDGFGGNHDPAPWTTLDLAWRGSDDGSSTAAGLRSYGTGGDGSLGWLPGGQGTTATAAFTNGTGETITALEIAFDVEQWRAALGGAADGLSAALHVNGGTIPLPELSHVASQSLPTGAIAGGLTTPKAATVAGLAILPGAAFELRVSFTPGTGGGALPAEIFVNEFHYDNDGTDAGEFIEIAVGPGFEGDLSDIDVVLYNGGTPSAAVTYGTALNLGSFTHGGTSNGYAILYHDLPQDGLQNGGNDGFAIVNTATSQVLQLISYEGSFTAGNGPAAGMTSVSVGVSQSGATPAGSSLGLAGTGGVPADFQWAATPGARTKGAPNDGQSFVPPALLPQGLAIDNVRVTATIGGDFDQDGQPDTDEIAFGTDPLDAGSVFRPAITRNGGLSLSFPGASGISYTVETSTDLSEWDELSIHPGAGQLIVVPLPEDEPAMFFRVKAGE